MWQIWLIASGVFFILEIFTVGFLLFWLGVAALLATVVGTAALTSCGPKKPDSWKVDNTGKVTSSSYKVVIEAGVPAPGDDVTNSLTNSIVYLFSL